MNEDTMSDSNLISLTKMKMSAKVAELYDKVKRMRCDLGAVPSLLPASQHPPWLFCHLKEAFQFNIYQEVQMKMSVMFARCYQ